MVEETYINKLPKKLKTKNKGIIGLTDVNEKQYIELQKLWKILQKEKKN
jgi:hypothetical protein